MIDLKEFEQTLTTMSTRSKAFQLVKAEMLNRGHWKAKDRGISGKELDRKRKLRSLDIHSTNVQQVRAQNGYANYDENAHQ